MRHYILALPILALSACSILEQPNIPNNTGANSGQYSQGCSTGACAPGQSYSVAGQHQSAQTHQGANQGAWSGQNGGAYGQGPVHVNPTGHGQNGYRAHQAAGYGQPPHLRGSRGQKRGHFYGTIGGVLHDVDLDSYGIEGRLGYNSGRYLGAEIEGSIGLIDDNDTIQGFDVESRFDYNVAAFAVARLPLGNRFSLHARGGYDFREFSIEAEAPDGTLIDESIDLDGFAYGFGAEYALSPRSGLRLDYTEYRGGSGLGAESVSASFTRKF